PSTSLLCASFLRAPNPVTSHKTSYSGTSAKPNAKKPAANSHRRLTRLRCLFRLSSVTTHNNPAECDEPSATTASGRRLIACRPSCSSHHSQRDEDDIDRNGEQRQQDRRATYSALALCIFHR